MRLVAPETITFTQSGFCPGWGHGLAVRLIAEVMEEMGLSEQLLAIVDVACGSLNIDSWRFDTIMAAHGRPVATAIGVKKVRPENPVMAYIGDGAAYSIGMAETMHAALRNDNVVTIVINNSLYGMTGGQCAPTSLPGQITTSTPRGKDPKKADRDRFVLSKGHTAPGLYSALAQKGYFPVEDLETLRHLGSYLQGHPDMKHIPGVDMSSGSLGQGISAAVGMALGAKLQNKAFRVYTLLGDGEIQEGQVWEAAMFAGAKHLDNLVVIVDNNGLQIDGNVADVNSPYPIDKKFEAFNFHVINVADGNDFDQLKAAFDEARTVTGMPTAIITKTVKGKGVSFMENQVGWHGKAPNDEEYKIAMEELEKAGEALCQK